MNETVTLTFRNDTSALAFYQWWTNEGREFLEDAIPGVQVNYPTFNADHRVAQGVQFQSIDYAP
jgi:hypothetical protein